MPAYVQALLQQTAESLDNLQRTMARGEDNRTGSHGALLQLAERLSVLTDQMRAEQSLLVKLIRHEGEPNMPEDADKLSDEAIEQITSWIATGAAYDTPLIDAEHGNVRAQRELRRRRFTVLRRRRQAEADGLRRAERVKQHDLRNVFDDPVFDLLAPHDA